MFLRIIRFLTNLFSQVPVEPQPIKVNDSVRPEDGPQDVSQDPNVVYDENGNVVQWVK